MTLHKLTCHRDTRGHAFLTAEPVALRKVLAVRPTPRRRSVGRCPRPPGWGGARGYESRAERMLAKATYRYVPAAPSPARLAVLSLFSGIGGIDLGLEMTGHFYTVGFCEIEEFPRKVLRKHWGADIPIFEDVHDVTIDAVRNAGIKRVDVIAGGFPCQDISIAGKQAGIKAGTRSGLWIEFARIIGELRPRYVLLENVAAITSVDGVRVIADLTEMGYDADWATLFASDTGAPHTRERWFCVGYLSDPKHAGQDIKQGYFTRPENRSIGANKQAGQHLRCETGRCGELAHASGSGCKECDPSRVTCDAGYLAGRHAAVGVAHCEGLATGIVQFRDQAKHPQTDNASRNLGHSDSQRLQGRSAGSVYRSESEVGRKGRGRPSLHATTTGGDQENSAPESRLGRVFDGLPRRLDSGWVARPNEQQYGWEPPRILQQSNSGRARRLKALGNAVVPQVVAFVGECLWRFHVKQAAPPFALRVRPTPRRRSVGKCPRPPGWGGYERTASWYIRRATMSDKQAILRIAHQHSAELGYVHPVALAERLQRGTVLVAEFNRRLLGFVDYHVPQRGANKGYQVVYHLAVDKGHQGRGIGRALLHAVPCPIRLKCTADNARANRFYKHVGMMLVRTEPGSKRALNVWQLNTLFIQVAGDNRQYADAAHRAGIAYGCRHDDPPKAYPFMFDIRWDDYDWQHYLALLRHWRPVQAMVADYERPDQRDLMLGQIANLRALGIPRIMACAKFNGAVAHIPTDCIVAISVPAPTYAGFVASDLNEYRSRKIHLLGGSPRKQRDLLLRLNAVDAIVVSMDGNYHTRKDKSNQVFVGGTFERLKRFEKVNYYRQIEMSGRNIAMYMNASADWQQPGLQAAPAGVEEVGR